MTKIGIKIIDKLVGAQTFKVNCYTHDIHDEADEVMWFIRGALLQKRQLSLEKNPSQTWASRIYDVYFDIIGFMTKKYTQ